MHVCACYPSANHLILVFYQKGGICDRALPHGVPANCTDDCRTHLCPSSCQNIHNNFNLSTESGLVNVLVKSQLGTFHAINMTSIFGQQLI